MRALLLLIAGVLLVVVGGVWTLQGVGVLGGSVMSGVTMWAVIEPVVVLVGIYLFWRGMRRRPEA